MNNQISNAAIGIVEGDDTYQSAETEIVEDVLESLLPAANLLSDLQDKGGSFRAYVEDSRLRAVQTIKAMLDIDVDDTQSLRTCQNVVNRYRDVLRWIQACVDADSAAHDDFAKDDAKRFNPSFAAAPDDDGDYSDD